MPYSRLVIVVFIVLFMISGMGFLSNTGITDHRLGGHYDPESLSRNTTEINNSNSGYYLKAPKLVPRPLNATGGWSGMRSLIISRLDRTEVPAMARSLPNYAVSPVISGGNVLPSYTSAPAPMGIASYGIINQTGRLSAYTYYTGGFEGTLNLSSASEFYMGSDAPHSFSLQLNAVLNNVTLFGKTGYQFWTQNVVDYSTRTSTLTFVDNIWNFSSPQAVINGNEFHSYNGTVVPGVFYYDIGPSFTVTYPFTLSVYLGTGIIDGYNAVFFNYTLSGTALNGSHIYRTGSYDRVEFNSTSSGEPHLAIPALFEVSGNHLSNTGFIPLDAEFVLGGPGGGSTADFYNISGTMDLSYKNSNEKYVPVESAYDVGSETGETASGFSEYFTGTAAHLGTGPSFVIPMWNLSTDSGYGTVSGQILPGNAFLFVTQSDHFSNSTSQWAPLSNSGRFVLNLPPGNYSFAAILSRYSPLYWNLSVSKNTTKDLNSINLDFNSSAGFYTPIYADGNQQLRNLSITGNGTVHNPFLVAGPEYYSELGMKIPASLSGLFSRINDYLFPVFYGLLLRNISNYSLFTGFRNSGGNSPFGVEYSTINLQALTQEFDVPQYDYLPSAFYDSSNFTVENSTFSGWFSTIVYTNYTPDNVPPVASLILWNSTGSLVDHNSFLSQGSGMIIYNQNNTFSGNYVWNNTFANYPEEFPGMYYGFAPIGLTVESSGNTIFNNVFRTTITMISIDGKNANIYTGKSVLYHNRYNVSREKGSSGITVDGTSLHGSIINGTFPGGNYYYDYFGNGSVPYNGSGLGLVFNGQGIFNGSINDGYDYSPLTLHGYSTNVSARGLPQGQTTYFDINNAIYPIQSGSATTLYLPNGSYFISGFTLENSQVELQPQSYIGKITLPSDEFSVLGPLMNITVVYSELFNLSVQESGLPPGTVWGFAVPAAGEGFELSSTSTNLFVPAGSYYIYPQAVEGYYAVPFEVNISGPSEVTVQYQNVSSLIQSNYTVIFTENGLPAGTKWSVTINGQTFSANSSSMMVSGFQNGNYTYIVSQIPGFKSISGGRIVINNGNATVNIVYARSSVNPFTYVYMATTALVAGIAGALLVYSRYRRH